MVRIITYEKEHPYGQSEPLDVWAAFLLHHAEGGSGNFCYQAITLKTSSQGSMNVTAILQR
jgi:hypothetical protein